MNSDSFEQVTLNVAPQFRTHLQLLAQRLRLEHDYQALEAALALMEFCSRELVESNAHVYVEYPDGQRRMIELRRTFKPKLVPPSNDSDSLEPPSPSN